MRFFAAYLIAAELVKVYLVPVPMYLPSHLPQNWFICSQSHTTLRIKMNAFALVKLNLSLYIND